MFRIVFTVRNDASVQDIFDTNVIFDFANDWVISDITPSRLFLNAGDTGTFSAIITAPPQHKLVMTAPHILVVLFLKEVVKFLFPKILII